jgi:tetratricopeptide (TPR) repeat protein
MQVRLLFLALSCLAVAACSGSGTGFSSGRQALLRGEPDNAVAYFDRVAQADPGYIASSPLPRKSIWTYVGRAHYNSGRYADAKVAFDKALTHLKDDYVARLYRGLTLLRVQSATPPPANVFTLQEVSYALREGVSPRRVSTLARERGVAFDLNLETENQLKNAGADTILLDDLRKLRAERAKQNQPSDNQRTEGAKDITAALTALRDWLSYTIANTPQGRFWDPSGEIRADISRGLRAATASSRDWEAIVSGAESVGYKLEEEGDRARRDEADDFERRRR